MSLVGRDELSRASVGGVGISGDSQPKEPRMRMRMRMKSSRKSTKMKRKRRRKRRKKMEGSSCDDVVVLE